MGFDFKDLKDKARKAANDAARKAEDVLNQGTDPDDPNRLTLRDLAGVPLIVTKLFLPGMAGVTVAVIQSALKVDEDKSAEAAAEIYNRFGRERVDTVVNLLDKIPADQIGSVAYKALEKAPGHVEQKVSAEKIEHFIDELKQISTQMGRKPNGPDQGDSTPPSPPAPQV